MLHPGVEGRVGGCFSAQKGQHSLYFSGDLHPQTADSCHCLLLYGLFVPRREAADANLARVSRKVKVAESCGDHLHHYDREDNSLRVTSLFVNILTCH